MKQKQQDVLSGIELVSAVAGAIRNFKEVPSGHLYPRLSGVMSYPLYEKIITLLMNAGLVELGPGDTLRWLEEAYPPTNRQSSMLMDKNNDPEWADEKYVTRKFGITHTPLYTLRKIGKIRSASLRCEGRTYGKRLYHIGSIREFLTAQESSEARRETKPE